MVVNFFRILVAVIISITWATGAFSQSTEVPFGGFKHDPALPVEVAADHLKVNQKDGSAVFTGNVVVGQGEMRLSAAEVLVEYGTKNGKSTGKISHMVATGGVTLVNGVEAAESRDADYNIDTGIVVMTGDVILTQGANALSSDKMIVHLETGIANMEGRVRTIFKPEGSE